MMISVVTVDAKLPALAKAAGSPRSAAAAAAATTATTAASATPATATTVASAAATATGHLHTALGARGIFLVEYVERRQADVSDFFFAERDLLIG
jgi:transketolase N-terminal domain/subunit